MKTLTLSLKKQWFDMIKAEIKKEEYREIKPHYIRQFIKFETLKNDLIRDYNFHRGFDEGHKKEVGQLLIEIAKLKDSIRKLLKEKTEQVMDEVFQKCLIYGEGFVPVEHAMRLVAATRQSNYKRCLALSQEWRSYASFCGMQSHCHNHRGFGKTAEKYTLKECHAWKCVKRWIAIAEKFKPNPTINRKVGTNALQR